MDILLSHGYFLREDPAEWKVLKPHPPLGLLYLAAHLGRLGFRTSVYDSTFGSRDEFRTELERRRPRVVGLYCNLLTRAPVLEQMQHCQSLGIPVVLGGPEPVNYPHEFLKRGADVVVAGEGELTLAELLPRLIEGPRSGLHSISGIYFQDEDGGLVRTPQRELIRDLDGLPWPNREAIDLGPYFETWRRNHSGTSLSLITSRGCPYTCTWCSHSVYGYTHRSRSTGDTADEIEFLIERYRPDSLWYADDVFALNRRWFFEFAAELDRRRIRIPFETISREDRLDREVIGQLADMGCRRLWIGAESGSQRILDAMQRRTEASRVPEVVRLLQQHGVQAGLFIMLGYEGEDRADLQATVDFLKRVAPDTYLTTVAYPIKGTPYYDTVADRVSQPHPWETSSDRDLDIGGRPSARFYRYAQRWIAGEVARHRHANSTRIWTRAKARLNSNVGRIGMWLENGAAKGVTADGRGSRKRSDEPEAG